MADHLDENALDNSIIPESENLSAEIVSIDNTSAFKTNPEPETMEVHHHPHVEKKSFKEYLFEGLMIFLAVSLGFIAENIREYFGDKEKEKQYIENIVKCLSTDTIELKKIIAININQLNYVDSLLSLKGSNLSAIENNQKFYAYTLNGIYGDWYFKPNDAAMQQLKASGSLRLIHRQAVIDSLFQNERNNAVLKDQQEVCYYLMKNEWMKFEALADESEFRNKNKFESDIINFRYIAHYSEPLYISKDEKDLRLFYGNAAAYGETIEFYIKLAQQQLLYTKSMIAFIKKEYHLE